jgi:prepilin-type N-terminal cleavage/methylation domain-containing protein
MTQKKQAAHGKSRTQRGYNLVEVLIAMALTGVVVLSIMGLFAMSRKNVYSGKQLTQAISIGNRVMESINTMDKRGVMAAFGIPGTAGTANTFRGVSYANSIVRTTDTIDGTTDPRGYMAGWLAEMNNNNKLGNGKVTLIFTPTADPTNNPAQMLTATVVRVRAFVTWSEERRTRELRFDTVKVQR